MGLFRILVPSWRFFDRPGHVPTLSYRLKFPQNRQGDWIPLFEKPKRKFYHLFLNPKGNLYLACQSLVDRLLDDSQRSKDLEKEISFQLVKNFIRRVVIESSNPATHFEFRIQIKSSDVLKTPEYEIQ